jgi:SAM-dependent methyltransferase
MSEATHDWDSSYQQEQPPPWDIGRPQPVFAELIENEIRGDVLDAGCGTGEHALLLAARGANVTGADLSETAIRKAQTKATKRGLDVTFKAGDILTMQLADSAFDAAIDSGLFHSFSDEDRVRYVDRLVTVLRGGGRYYLMCFSDRQPGDWGPRRITRAEIEAAFADGWVIERLEPAEFEINPTFGTTRVQAWLAVIAATESDPQRA